ncbi:MAG: hypothetical protein HYX69_09155 [Planctomycetia bacterium]|nr:hypothetical protein [Planctomycetia bacterium]
MSLGEPSTRHEAAMAFNLHEGRDDGERIAASLMAGLDTLTNLMLARISTDVEREFGADSMLLPVSAVKGQMNARKEVEIYQAVESADAARAGGYLHGDPEWYVRWLGRLRLGELFEEPGVAARVGVYGAKPPDARRLAFESALGRTLPEAARAPLAMYRLFPPAVWIVTATAFADQPMAEEMRRQQLNLLPNLADCHACRARLMEGGEECRQCGNPFWKLDWVTAE